MQEWDAETFSDSSKHNSIKASSKLFLFQRLKSKKQKHNNKSPPKNKHEGSTEDSGPELDTPPSPKVIIKTWLVWNDAFINESSDISSFIHFFIETVKTFFWCIINCVFVVLS